MRVAVCGMGRMGHALADRLLTEKHEVVVWNRSPHRADDLLDKGATEAASPAEAARSAEAVLTSLTDDGAVLAVATGKEGVASGLTTRGVYVDTSTVAPEVAAQLAEATGGRYLASPILGAPTAVEKGEAAFLVAGPKEHFERLEPLYASLTDRAQYLGEDPRLALELKLLSNYLLMAGVVVLSEVVAAAEAIGFRPEVLHSFLEQSPLVAPGLRNRLDGLFATEHEGWFTTALGAKDVALAERLAAGEGVRLPVADLVKRRYSEAAAEGLQDDDLTAVIELVRKQR
jgi:3-hydroxyisobutyrate dehydrogenase-like beta-hydroxyacid dehydrogenase